MNLENIFKKLKKHSSMLSRVFFLNVFSENVFFVNVLGELPIKNLSNNVFKNI